MNLIQEGVEVAFKCGYYMECNECSVKFIYGRR